MGQAMRIMTYDRAANERNAISALTLLGTAAALATTSVTTTSGEALSSSPPLLRWYRLDDGVMGGQSESSHALVNGNLLFAGVINTNGGGFTSIRAKIPKEAILSSTNIDAVRIQFRGDGKTYKLLLSDGKPSTGAPFSRTPSWQADIVTNAARCDTTEEDPWDVLSVRLDDLHPSFGGGPRAQPSAIERETLKFVLSEMKEIGFMLSLRLSNGEPNPIETFGDGIFPFSLEVRSIEFVEGDATTKST